MIRDALLALSRSPAARRHLPRLPLIRRGVSRFMPGEQLEDALGAIRRLGGEGFPAVLTLLGEDVSSRTAVDSVIEAYGAALHAFTSSGLDVQLSVKPTQFGLALGEAVALEAMEAVAASAEAASVPLWIDMEGSATVDPTLRIHRHLRGRHTGVGICLQAALRRTPADLESLLPLEPRIRLVKGAYAEPPAVALAERGEVDRAYRSLALRVAEEAGRGRATLVLGTHDDGLLEEVRREAAGEGEGPWEVHMLYGIREELQRKLRDRGTAVRVLVSFGPGWFPWYMRRLAERPSNLWFALRGLTG